MLHKQWCNEVGRHMGGNITEKSKGNFSVEGNGTDGRNEKRAYYIHFKEKDIIVAMDGLFNNATYEDAFLESNSGNRLHFQYMEVCLFCDNHGAVIVCKTQGITDCTAASWPADFSVFDYDDKRTGDVCLCNLSIFSYKRCAFL